MLFIQKITTDFKTFTTCNSIPPLISCAKNETSLLVSKHVEPNEIRASPGCLVVKSWPGGTGKVYSILRNSPGWEICSALKQRVHNSAVLCQVKAYECMFISQ